MPSRQTSSSKQGGCSTRTHIYKTREKICWKTFLLIFIWILLFNFTVCCRYVWEALRRKFKCFSHEISRVCYGDLFSPLCKGVCFPFTFILFHFLNSRQTSSSKQGRCSTRTHIYKSRKKFAGKLFFLYLFGFSWFLLHRLLQTSGGGLQEHIFIKLRNMLKQILR